LNDVLQEYHQPLSTAHLHFVTQRLKFASIAENCLFPFKNRGIAA
jgi:hypothetical protein